MRSSSSIDAHLDVALELGPVGDDDARRLDVADDLAFPLHLAALGRLDVADDLPAHREGARAHARLDASRAGDGEVLLARDLAADPALDDEVLVALDLALDLEGDEDLIVQGRIS